MAESVKSADSLKPLTGDAYAEAYRHFMRSLIRPQEGPSLAYLKRTLPSLCLCLTHQSPWPLRILSIGAGTGNDDFWLKKNVFLPQSPDIHYDPIEPNSDHFQNLKKKALGQNVSGLHLHNVAFEEFPPPTKVDDRYDLVLLIHSLYYLSPTALPLILADYLRVGSGSIVILLDSPAGLPALQRGLGLPGAVRIWQLGGLVDSILMFDLIC
jgi:SAM-dependent methyltransferase